MLFLTLNKLQPNLEMVLIKLKQVIDLLLITQVRPLYLIGITREKLSILANGRDVYSCNYANHVVNIKNLLEYNPSYAESVATNEFYYLDTSRHAEKNKDTKRQVTHRRNEANNADEAGEMLDDVVANYNKGFSVRKVLLGDSATVRFEIPLNSPQQIFFL